MTAEPDLLPCPFCGGEAMHSGCDEHGYAVTCTNGECYAYNKAWPPTVDLAITAWNTRANVAHATAARDAEVEALRVHLRVAKQQTKDALSLVECSKVLEAASDALVRESEARAARLAEALQSEIKVLRQIASFGNMSDEMTAGVADRLEAALHPTAAQEGKSDD